MKSFKTEKGLELPLMDLQGKDYLQVHNRVRWFRSEYPFGRIDTERISESDHRITYRATVSVPDANGNYIKLANADKTVDIKKSTDIEKGETAAIGRALALSGFGTAFADDIEEGEHISDAPQEPKSKPLVYHHREFKGGEGAQGFHDPAQSYFQSLPDEPMPAFDEIPPKPDSSGEYICQVKKFKGKRLNSIDPTEVKSYVHWIEGAAKDKGETLKGVAKEFVDKAREYLRI